jgi:hypothetical protein
MFTHTRTEIFKKGKTLAATAKKQKDLNLVF